MRRGAGLNILILGGTGFTGPHQIAYAVGRGHRVTVFNRGRRQADLPKGVRHLVGDQIIDARDLAEWSIRMCEDRKYGVFNATGPPAEREAELLKAWHAKRAP